LLPILQHGANGYVLQVNVPSFSSFYFAGSNVSLPLQLLSFTGALQNNATALLNWKTTNEINTSRFIVERSTDAVHFSPIGTVAASGNTSYDVNYSFKDADVANQSSQNVFYRLKMIDIDAAYTYSNVVRILLPGTKGILTLSPNPAADDIKASIVSAAECNATWQIIDIAGRLVMQNAVLLKKGENEVKINLKSLTSGTYYLKIAGSCIDLKTKFQKME
jgi:hypothetical protein